MNGSLKRGVSLVEVLIGAFILTIFVTALVIAFQSFLTHSFATVPETQATFLAEEGIEAVKMIRDSGWSNITALTAGTPYYLHFGTDWTASPTEEYVGIFQRTFIIENVGRNASKDIVVSGGTDDSNTKKITVNVSWSKNSATSTKSIATYITNIHE